ncbi:MAG: adenylate kinase [Chloroflexi bacterium]|nr:adenylate kinase [Chloroflexota bacterium]
MYTVIIGAAGAGKGTQAAAVQKKIGPHLASGDMFREAMAQGTPIGLEVRRFVNSGSLVPDVVAAAMVLERLSRDDARNGAVLDGFPRTVAQAEALDRELEKRGQKVDQALYLNVPEDELLRRLAGRWLCRVCQMPYHEVSNPPKVAGKCDKDGGDLFQRRDDTSDAIRTRLDLFFTETVPLLDYYRSSGVLDEIDGAQEIEKVSHDVVAAVRRRKGV